MRAFPPLPSRIGPVEFVMLAGMVALHCPQDFVPISEARRSDVRTGSRRWLVDRRRIGPVIRALGKATGPLFRHAGMSLD
jgi:hypothetical protein